VKPQVDGAAAHVPQRTLDQPIMAIVGIVHVQADFLHGSGSEGCRRCCNGGVSNRRAVGGW
jgi:hypothetical protein